jgi:hypothetical protein
MLCPHGLRGQAPRALPLFKVPACAVRGVAPRLRQLRVRGTRRENPAGDRLRAEQVRCVLALVCGVLPVECDSLVAHANLEALPPGHGARERRS